MWFTNVNQANTNFYNSILGYMTSTRFSQLYSRIVFLIRLLLVYHAASSSYS